MSEGSRNDLGRDEFFIGWAGLPQRGLGSFLSLVTLYCVVGFGAVAFAVAATQDDPGDGAFRGDFGRQTITGVVETQPYPLLYVVESERFPAGHVIMLSGGGKNGAQRQTGVFDGSLVEASGAIIKRGDLDMLQLRGGQRGMMIASDAAAEGDEAPIPAPVPLGRWRLTGEICDGKCYAGAMRPGAGLAHKACANLCLIGGTPPVFVSTDPVEGQSFFLLADLEGGPVTEEILDHVALLVQVEGLIERRGDLLVFRIDPATIEAP